MKFLRNRPQFGSERGRRGKDQLVETETRVDAFVRSPSKPTFTYRAPVSWSATGYGIVRVDHFGAHDDDQLGSACAFGGDCVEVLEFDSETASLSPHPIHVAWPRLTQINVDKFSEPIDLRAPVVQLDAFRTGKVWGEMKRALTPEPRAED